jgi:hypothetical protein
MSILNSNHFYDEAASQEFLKARVRPRGPICPHCGSNDRITNSVPKPICIDA